MKSILFLITIFSLQAMAKVYNFIPCSQKQEVTEDVRQLLNEPKKAGNAHFVGFYELKKQGHVVGYVPFHYHRGQQLLGFVYACSNHWDDSYYNHTENIKDWIPNFGQTLKVQDWHNDEAVSHIILTRINQTEVSMDVFIRSFGGGNDVIKDVITLSLIPKYKL